MTLVSLDDALDDIKKAIMVRIPALYPNEPGKRLGASALHVAPGGYQA